MGLESTNSTTAPTNHGVEEVTRQRRCARSSRRVRSRRATRATAGRSTGRPSDAAGSAPLTAKSASPCCGRAKAPKGGCGPPEPMKKKSASPSATAPATAAANTVFMLQLYEVKPTKHVHPSELEMTAAWGGRPFFDPRVGGTPRAGASRVLVTLARTSKTRRLQELCNRSGHSHRRACAATCARVCA